MKRVAALALLALVAAGALAAPPGANAGNYGKREDVHQFIAEMVERHGFVGRELRKLFSRALYQPAPPAAGSWRG